MSDIGARFVACRRWRWMPGMLAADHGEGVRVSGVCAEFIHGSAAETPVNRHGPVWMRLRRDAAHVPVVEDPATLGCILALVREAWGRPTMHLTRFHANVRDDSGAFTVPAVWWRFVDGDEPEPILVETEDRRRYLAGATEAEAMRCALELAP